MITAQHGATTLTSEVYGMVRRRILKGDLPPGQPISRRTVAAEVRTSLLPVAEALHRLEFEGLLESRPRAGTRVRIPSVEDVKGHFVVREALEVQAAIRAAAVASGRELQKLQAMAERVDGLARGDDPHAYATVHLAFHRRIAEMSRCKSLCDALEQTHAFATLWLARLRHPRPEDSARLHQDLADAVATRDAATAAEAVRLHVAEGQKRSLEVLQPYFDLLATTGPSFQRIRAPRGARRQAGPARS